MARPLPRGLYEQLLDEELQQRIAAAPEMKPILRQLDDDVVLGALSSIKAVVLGGGQIYSIFLVKERCWVESIRCHDAISLSYSVGVRPCGIRRGEWGRCGKGRWREKWQGPKRRDRRRVTHD